ncbi:YDG domain-containing protein [Kinneretia asaccharophila]|uniref:Filamentous hemagglutinin family protein n=2 Tax=Roseateles asaccharophilus TaxID=582607 RepID=A0A4R6NBW8_9BURK|nr:YDG domain-containing protein [Roseateles asaccharophilus]MDN3543036.1 YDG domain-containing protein [Roseateles asaccharophilus]TDP13266.1 filamentous hemagglutinin family protein [Roseateles asaccharophilus]
MNHAFRLVWSDESASYVPVPENAKARGKRSGGLSRGLLAGVLLGLTGLSSAQVLPGGAQIGAGQAQINSQGGQMTVQQGSDKLILNWNSFNIGSGASVRFEQPHASAVVLNRVLGGGASQIDGQLTANGQVWLINPQGVAFGKGAQVQVGALVAASLGVKDEDFLAGRARFERQGHAGAIRNEGRLQGEVVALLAPSLDNSGTVQARQTALVAADKVALDFGGDGLLQVQVERAALDAELRHSGRIEGERVLLSAQGASALRASVLNMDGVIEARGLSLQGGRIMLDGGEQGSVQLRGTLDAGSTQGQGGRIEVQGRDISLNGANLEASGATGGGLIHVGGGWQGQDASLRNAQTLKVDAASTARADAREQGHGGEVVFWSDGRTEFAGTIGVRGGAQGGDGGRAEVSGKQELAYRGHTDARAAKGRTGDLLLDPATITVKGGAGSGDISGSEVFEKDLEAQAANVLLQASGNISFTDLSQNGGDGKISMQPDVSLRVETGGVGGNISFANKDNTIEVFGRGSIMMVAGGTDTGEIINAPNLIAHGTGANVATLPTHNVSSVGSGTPADASITLFGADGITVGGSITTHGGYVRMWADSDNMSGGGLTLSKPLSTGGGHLHLSAGTGAVVLNSDMDLGTGRIFFKADGSHSSGEKVLGGFLKASGDVDVNTAFTFKGGSKIYTDGTIRFGNVGVKLDTGSGVLTLRAGAIDWGSATLNNLSTASLRLEPFDAATNMVLGDASGFASAATLAKLPGIKNLTIGREDGTGTVSVGSDFSFNASGFFEMVNKTVDITAGTLTNTAGGLTLTGDTINISKAVTANSGAGKVTLRQMTAANELHLGTGLNNATIGQVNAGTLEVGRSDGGNLVFDSDITTTASSVHLKSGQRVLGVNGGVAAANLAVTAGAGAEISDSTFNFSTLALKTGGDSSVTSSQANWGLGTVDGLAGLSIDRASSVTLKSSGNGVLGLKAPINFNSTASTLRLEADEFVAANASVPGDKATVSGQSLATVEFARPGAGTAFTVGGVASKLSEASLQAFNNVKVMRIDAQDHDVTLNALQVTVADKLDVRARNLTQAGTQRVVTGSLHISSEQGGLMLNNAVQATGTLSLNDKAGVGISGSGRITAAKLALRSTGNAVLSASNHQVGEIAASVAQLKLSNETSLTVGTADGLNGVSASDSVDLRALGANSDLILNQAVSAGNSSAAGTPLLLQAGRNFVNNAGASALTAGGAGRWLVYSTTPTADTRGGLSSAFKQYDATPSSSVLGTGHGFLYTVAPTITVTLIGSISKVYDGLRDASLGAGNFASSGAIDGDTVNYTVGGPARYADKNVGNAKQVSVDGLAISGASKGAVQVYGYRLASTTASGAIGRITAKQLSLAAGSVSDKVYDGGTLAQIGAARFIGMVAGDGVSLDLASGTARFADKNVGQGKNVTLDGFTLSGTDAGNYTLAQQTSASITPREVTLRADVASKVYDGSTAAVGAKLEVLGLVAGDAISMKEPSVRFADKHVGSKKQLVLDGQLSGADAGNYRFVGGVVASEAAITPKTVTVEQLAVASKVYDGLRDATVSGKLSGTVAGDQLGLLTQGQFDTKNAGQGKDVAVKLALSGADAGNYQLADAAPKAKGEIRAKTLELPAVGVKDKIYDGKHDAELLLPALQGLVAGDQLGLQGEGLFDTPAVALGKPVQIKLSLSGADAANYRLSQPLLQALASILPASSAQATTALLVKPLGGNGTQSGAVPGAAPASGSAATGIAAAAAQAAGGAGFIGGLVDASALAGDAALAAGSTGGGAAAGAAQGGPGNSLAAASAFSMEQVISHQGQLSLATSGEALSEPRQSLLPVYREQSGNTQPQGLAQLRVDDLGDSLAVNPVASAAPQREAARAAVSRRAETLLELANGESVWLRLEWLEDGTLRTLAPRLAESLGHEALSTFSLSTLKQQAGVSPNQVRAVLLSFEG